MSFFEAILLGIIQGLTEFFPVSSSGHLILMEHLLGYQDLKGFIFFDLVCHLGTLGAVFFVFSSAILEALTSKTRALQFALATLPLFPLVLAMKQIKSLFDQPELLGYCFLITASFLFLGQLFGKQRSEAVLTKTKYRDAIGIGLSQAVAIIPGISRSGSTISTALLLGWKPQDAVAFSFLLSIPTVLGGIALESGKIWSSTAPLPEIAWSTYCAGFATALIVGTATLHLLLRIVGTAKFQFFAWYCLMIGIFTLYLFH